MCCFRTPASNQFQNRTPEIRETASEEKTEGPIFPSASLRTGKTVQGAKVPLGPRKGANGPGTETDAHAGEDLVPEQEVQEQEAEDRERRNGEVESHADGE